MLPFGLGVTWFLLSIIGTINCWAVFISFCRVAKHYWPLIYCFGCTITHGIFWMGMISRMQASNMSHGLCTAQLIMITFGIYIMTGVTAVFVVITVHASYKPKIWKEGLKGIMSWSPLYVFLSYVFPIVGSGVQLAIMAFFDLDQRSDNLFCDYSNPTWTRLTAYAGTPWAFTIPCLYFSITTLRRIHKTNKHLERSRDPDVDIENLTEMPRRPEHIRMVRVSSSTSSRHSDHQTLNSSLAGSRGLHGHPIPTTVTFNTSTSSISAESQNSSLYPTFTTVPRTDNTDRDSVSSTVMSDPKEGWRDISETSDHSILDVDKADPVKRADGTKGEERDEDTVEDDCSSIMPHPTRRSTLMRNPRKMLPVLPPEIYWLIYFQIAFVGIQVLCSISTIVDVARGGPPAAFGTQHIALLMWAWVPAIFLVNWRDVLKRYSRQLPKPVISCQQPIM